MPAILRDGEVQLLGTRRPVAGAAPPEGAVVALVRPEALLVTRRRRRAGRVVTRTFSGASTRVLVALPDGVEVRVDLPSAVSGELTPGTAVTVRPAERPVLVAPPEPAPEIAAEAHAGPRRRSVGGVPVHLARRPPCRRRIGSTPSACRLVRLSQVRS